MAKLWTMALALLVGAGVWAAPAMAQSSDADDVGNIERIGGENGATNTALGASGLQFSTDGFSLHMRTVVQFRFTHQQEVANGEDGTNGRNFNNFRLPLARTTFSGHIFEREFQYNVRLGWVNGGDSIVEVAHFRWAANPYINVNAGQHKIEFNWEEGVLNEHLTFADRSATNAVFNQNYGKGVWIDGQVGEDVPMLKYWVGIYNGVLAGSEDFRNADMSILPDAFIPGVVDGDLMINLRAETHPMGEVERRMGDNRSEEEHSQILIAVGLGINYFTSTFSSALRLDDAGGTPASGRPRTYHNTLAVVLDGHFRFIGLSVDLELFYRRSRFQNSGSNSYNPGQPTRDGIRDLTDYGMALEVGYFIIPQELNVALRFAVVTPDKFWFGGSSSQGFGVRPETIEIGVGANYYVHGDNLRLTMDILHVSQRLPMTAGWDVQGIYNDPEPYGAFGGSGESSDFNNLWIIRLQLQWMF